MVVSVDFENFKKNEHEQEGRFQAATVICAFLDHRTGSWTRRLYDIRTVGQIWTLLEKFTVNKKRIYLVMNNSNWTLTALDVFQTGPKLGWKVTQLVLNCPPCIVRLRKHLKGVTILDIQNIWPQLWLDTSIGGLTGKRSNAPPKAEPLPEERPSIAAAEMMFKTMTEWWSFLKSNDLGGFAPTVGAQSMRTWRHRWMTHKVLIDCHDDALKLARDGLFGGRNEVYKYGIHRGAFTMLDTNGSYCSVLAGLEVPTKLVGYTERATVADIQTWSHGGVVIAEVVVASNDGIYPVRSSTRMVFPRGIFTTVLAGRELVHALGESAIVRVKRAAVYESRVAFRAYSHALWDMRIAARRSGDVANETKWKILAASFWGKWAQKGGYWEDYERTSDLTIGYWIQRDVDARTTQEFRRIGGVVQRRNTEQESCESSPAIGACITAAARLNLYALIRTCGRDHTYYVDTDSILVDAVGLGRLRDRIRPDQLGELHVCWHANSVSLWHQKDYQRDGWTVNSSVCSNADVSESGRVVSTERLGLEAQILSGVTPGARARTVVKQLSR